VVFYYYGVKPGYKELKLRLFFVCLEMVIRYSGNERDVHGPI